jgi:hypothetical protein
LINTLTYNRKLKICLWTSGLLLLIAYKLIFAKSIALINDTHAMENQSMQMKTSSSKTGQLKQQIVTMDKLLARYIDKNTKVQDALLSIVTRYSLENKILLREFPRSTLTSDKNMLIETNVFTVEGNYNHLLLLAYLLEQKQRVGRLSSLKFISKHDPRTNMLSLCATMYIQTIHTQENEK